MATRKGTLLEQNVETIFSNAGFKTESNVFLADYEVDVHAEIGDIEIIAECKQYESSNLQVRNLIHEWKGKNKSIDADIVVIVIYGQDLSGEERTLARDNNIALWDEEEIEKLLHKDDEEIRNYLFNELPIKKQSLGESQRERIGKLVWKPYLEGKQINDDYAHEELLLTVKERIRRELFQEGTEIQERKDHITVFEDVTKKGIIRSKVKVKNSKERFSKIAGKLDQNNTPLSESREKKYLRYMKSVKEVFEDAKGYYIDSEGYQKIKRIVEARLKFLLKHGGEVEFSPRKSNKPIKASRENAKISIDFEIDDAGDLETIRWILTREGSHSRIDKNNRTKHRVSFVYDDIEEAVEAVIRIITEYYGYELQDIRLVDKKKDQLSRGQNLFTELLR